MKRKTIGKILITPFIVILTLGIISKVIMIFIENPIKVGICISIGIMTTTGLYLLLYD